MGKPVSPSIYPLAQMVPLKESSNNVCDISKTT
jgi:hypothetical protein